SREGPTARGAASRDAPGGAAARRCAAERRAGLRTRSVDDAWIYARTTRARDGVGRWALVALLLLAYLSSLGGSAPPSVATLATVALIGAAIIFVMAWWVDRHRVTV